MTVSSRGILVVGCALALSASMGVPAQAAVTAVGTRSSAQRTYTYVEIGVFGTASADGRGTSAGWALGGDGRVVGASTTSVFGAGHAFSWDGRLRDLGVLGGGGFSASAAYGIDASGGTIVGQTHVNATEPPHAFVHRNGRMTDLGTGYGAGSFSRAWDVNNNGVIVGEHSRSQSSDLRAALWRAGRVQDLGTLGGTAGQWGTSAIAHSVNDRDQVVGAALPGSGSGALHGFLWEAGAMRDLGTLGGDGESTVAYGINNQGQVVGQSPTASGATHAFLWQSGTMRDLGSLGDLSIAYGINDLGLAVGTARVPGGSPGAGGHAVVWEDGRLVDLNTVVTNLPGNVSLQVARAVGDDGRIVGTTCGPVELCPPGKDAPTRAFVLIPN